MIRRLDTVEDAAAVLGLYDRAAAYILFETGRPLHAHSAEDLFRNVAPGGDPSTSLKLGLFEDGLLMRLGDLAFGYPRSRDAYLGLMLLAPEGRGRGLGLRFLRHVEAAARERGATRLLLAALEGNHCGRAFWEREGFASPRVYPAVQLGERMHVRVQLEKPLTPARPVGS